MAKSKSKKGTKKPLRKVAKPTKAEKVEVNGASDDEPTLLPLLGGNMPPIRDIMYHLDTINGLQARARTAAGKVSDAKKKAKEAGVDLKAIAEGVGMERMDPLDLAAYLRQLQTIVREKGLPVQLTLYEPKYGSIEEQARNEGGLDGANGRTPNMGRWPEGTPGSVDYMRAWNDSQAEIIRKGSERSTE